MTKKDAMYTAEPGKCIDCAFSYYKGLDLTQLLCQALDKRDNLIVTSGHCNQWHPMSAEKYRA